MTALIPRPATPAANPAVRAAIAVAVAEAEITRDVEHLNQTRVALAAVQDATRDLDPGSPRWMAAVTPILATYGTAWAATDERHRRTTTHLTRHPDVVDLTDRAIARAGTR